MTALYVGLISGTSMDGIDAALVDFTGERPRLRHALNHPYPRDLHARLEQLLAPDWQGPVTEIGHLHAALGTRFGEAARHLLSAAGVSATDVRAIGSHGQTVCHAPSGDEAFSLQLADASRIAAVTGITTVADFRSRDIALGGQGAPLVPAFHAAVLGADDEHRVILNLGGIANVTDLPAGPARVIRGFDTGPANTLMDGWIRRHAGSHYDQGGAWAVSGTPIPALLGTLLEEPYLALPPPKSTGRELFNLAWLDRHLACWAPGAAPADVQATLLEFTAVTVAEAIARHCGHPARVIACGGGAHNHALMRRLGELLPDSQVESSADHDLPPDWVEAMTFAWLARQTLRGQPGNLPSVTGARRAAVLGAITPVPDLDH
ncbi:MAG TPA: anhydro-N-acetylmuramic acid kinase [Thioalkalivibrio sp.]|nr:anhydro-N-acetylmuramic acid kinase [Thioalkalivibrio sp.]